MWYLASIFLITESMSNQEVIEVFENTLQENECVQWYGKDMMIYFCGGVEQVVEKSVCMGSLESWMIFMVSLASIVYLINLAKGE